MIMRKPEACRELPAGMMNRTAMPVIMPTAPMSWRSFQIFEVRSMVWTLRSWRSM